MNLQLMLGGEPCPNFWCCMSEIICDLITAILHNDGWDLTALFGRIQHLVPSARRLDDSIPFGEGQELIIEIEVNARGTKDIYIDNLGSIIDR
jgi:hypothetical protein